MINTKLFTVLTESEIGVFAGILRDVIDCETILNQGGISQKFECAIVDVMDKCASDIDYIENKIVNRINGILELCRTGK